MAAPSSRGPSRWSDKRARSDVRQVSEHRAGRAYAVRVGDAHRGEEGAVPRGWLEVSPPTSARSAVAEARLTWAAARAAASGAAWKPRPARPRGPLAPAPPVAAWSRCDCRTCWTANSHAVPAVTPR